MFSGVSAVTGSDTGGGEGDIAGVGRGTGLAGGLVFARVRGSELGVAGWLGSAESSEGDGNRGGGVP